MSNSYDPVQIAWKVIEVANKCNIPITHMQLQKLVYIAHGFCLAGLGKPLISEPVTAWKYGPVIPRIYQEFKRFGGAVIRAENRNCSILLPPAEEQLITSVVQSYGSFTGVQLSELTHMPGSPWYQVWFNGGSHQDNTVIPNFIIEAQYQKILCGQPNSCL